MKEWTILRTLVVRTTGFPIDLLTELRFERTVALIEALLECEAQLAALREQILAEVLPGQVRHAYAQERSLLPLLSRWRRAIVQGQAIDPVGVASHPALAQFVERWNGLCGRRNALYEQGRATWRAELDTGRRALAALAERPDVREALFLSSPDMYAMLKRYCAAWPAERTSGPRKFERRLIFYLQRLCAKNETQSFFGPINYGRLDAESQTAITVQRAEEPLRQRATFASHWLAAALARQMSVDPALQPFLRPRRSPACRLNAGQALEFPANGRSLRLSSADARLWLAADGRSSVAELAALLGEGSAATWERVVLLQQQHALVAEILVPGATSEPLAYLRGWVDDLPAELPARASWDAILAQFDDLVGAFARADLAEREQLLARLEARFGEVCGTPARRGAGAMYADRMLLFEECLGDLIHCTIGGAWARAIERRLTPILRLAAIYGRLVERRDRRIAFSIWQDFRPPDGQAIPFLRYLQQARRHEPAAPPQADELERFLEELRALVQARSDGHRARLCSAELPLPALPPDPDSCAYCSIDVMIAAPGLGEAQAGPFSIVLGECHPPPLAWVFPTGHFLAAEHQPLARELHAALGRQPGSAVAAQFVFNRKSKIYPYELPGARIELRPVEPRCDAIPAAALTVRERDGRLWLNDGERDLRLYTPLQRSHSGTDVLAPFAFPAVQTPPIRCGAHTPRIEIDDVVYQRERWVVPGGPLGDAPARDFDLFVQALRWQARWGMPREMFARAPQEPKPVYIDLTNYFFVELLDYLARQSSELEITEMAPNSRELWLDGPAGRHCCEFRMTAFAEPESV